MKALVISSALLALVSSPALASACFGADEMKSVRIRQLQTELMVAALKCSYHANLDLSGRYNVFIDRFGPQVSRNNKTLQGHFQKVHGKEWQRRFDGFVTRLANDASDRSQTIPDYCPTSAKLYDTVMAMDFREMSAFASSSLPPAPGVSACKP